MLTSISRELPDLVKERMIRSLIFGHLRWIWNSVVSVWNRFRKHLIPILVILVASTCVLAWFRGFMLYYWDSFFPFNPTSLLASFQWPWSDLISTGVPYPTSSAIPYVALVYVLHNFLGLSLLASQMALYYSLLAAGGIAMYSFFIYQAEPRVRGFWQLRFGALAAALIYMFNPYWMVYVWQVFSLEAFLYATLPLLLLLFQRGIARAENGQSVWGPITAIAVVTVFAAPALGIPAYSIPLAIGLAIFYILRVISINTLRKRIATARFMVLAVVSLVLVHLWWIYPTLLLYNDQLIRAGGTSYGIEGLNDLIFNSANTSYFNVFRISGIISFYRSVSYPHYDYAWMYQPQFLPMTFLSLSIPIAALLGLVTRIRTLTRLSQLFAAICIVGVMPLVVGIQPPFGGLYSVLAVNLPVASVVFRDPYQKFGYWLPFAFSFLIGVGFLAIAHPSSYTTQSRIKRIFPSVLSGKKRVSLLSILLIAMTVVYSWPMFTGNVIPQASSSLPSARIEIPDYYYHAASWLQSQTGDFRVLSLPKDQILQSSKWSSGYAGQDILRFLTGASIISTDPLSPGLAGFQSGLYNYIYGGGYNLAKPLRVLSVKFVLLRMDAGFYATVTPYANLTRIRLYLDDQPGLSVIREFGPLRFYEVDNPGPLVFASSVVYSAENVTETGWSLAGYDGSWQTSSLNMTKIGSILELTFESPGAYSYGYVTTESLGISGLSYPYLTVNFSSSPNAALLLRVSSDLQNDVWLTASQPVGASIYRSNQYTSSNPSTVTYDLSNIPGTLTSIDVFVTNSPQPTNYSKSKVDIYDMKFEGLIERPSDYARVIAGIGGDPLLHPVSNDLTSTLGNSQIPPPTLNFRKLSPVEYHVQIANVKEPFVLVLAETFDPRWNLKGSPIDTSNMKHINVDGFANGWIIERVGTYMIEIRFSVGNAFVWASYTSLIAFLALATATTLGVAQRSSRRSHSDRQTYPSSNESHAESKSNDFQH